MSKTRRVENVQPLRTQKEIQEMIIAIRRGNGAYPKRKGLGERDVLLFLVGINTGLRVSDIIKVKVGQVRNRTTFNLKEGKTNKPRQINIEMLQKEINDYTENMEDEGYLFKSQRGSNHITVTQVYRILTTANEYVGRDDI